MSAEVTLSSENFEAEVIKSQLPVLVDFWAEWCVPCKMIAPMVEEIAKTYSGKLKVGRVNVDDEGDLASQYSILSIPTLLVFKGGELVQRQVGAVSKPAMEGLFKEYL